MSVINKPGGYIMFSMEQKRRIADAVERALFELNHPEMPTERPRFHLRVDGIEAWSYKDNNL